MTAEISLHESIKQMHERVKEAGLSSVAERFQQQEKMRCKPCSVGLSCQLCSHGPCRIVPGKVDRGACGIDAAGIVMRNFIYRSVGIGLGAYIFHCKEVPQTLKATAQGKTPFSLLDERKLDLLAAALGVNASLALQDKAIKVGDAIIASLNQDCTDDSRVVSAFALESKHTSRRSARN